MSEAIAWHLGRSTDPSLLTNVNMVVKGLVLGQSVMVTSTQLLSPFIMYYEFVVVYM